MPDRTLIRGGAVVTPDGVRHGACVVVEDGHIAAVLDRPPPDRADVVDAAGGYVLPGLIDLHCDAIEHELQPRPGVLFPADLALRSLEGHLAATGITTAFPSVSFAEGEYGVRTGAVASELVEAVHRRAGISPVRLRVHLRYEITDRAALPVVRDLIATGRVQLLSFMDHTPGQGQYRELEAYRLFLAQNYGVGSEAFERLMDQKQAARRVAGAGLAGLAAHAQAHGVPLCSHDDDSPAKVDLVRGWGAAICEFPTTLEAARHAASVGMAVCVGAPNVVRGGSQGGGLSAQDAIASGAASMLCSDYYPAALLAAVFSFGTAPRVLPGAVRLATLHPARAAGLGEWTGSLEVGKWADVTLVRIVRGLPTVTATMLGGRWSYLLGGGRRAVARAVVPLTAKRFR